MVEQRRRPRLETGTVEGKIDFMQNAAGIPFDKLAEILPSDENSEINPDTLLTNFKFVVFMNAYIKEGFLPQVFQTRAEKHDNKSFTELMIEGKAKDLLGEYRSLFNWGSTG